MTNEATFPGMTLKQSDWYRRMEAELEAVQNAWSYDRALAYELFTDKLRRDIDTACERLKIDVPTAWDPDGWDGEEDAGINTTVRRLKAIRLTLAGEPIPAYWLVSYEDAVAQGTV